MVHKTNDSLIASHITDLASLEHLIKSNYNIYWASAYQGKSRFQDPTQSDLHKIQNKFIKFTKLSEIKPSQHLNNFSEMYFAGTKLGFHLNSRQNIKNFGRENRHAISSLASKYKGSIICFDCDNDIKKTDILIQIVIQHLIENYNLLASPSQLYYINTPEFLETNTNIIDTSTFVEPITISSHEKIHNDINNLKRIVSEIVEISNMVCESLSKKNAPEHHELRDLILQLRDALSEFSNELSNTKNVDRLNTAKEKAGSRINKFLIDLKNFDEKVEEVTDSRTGSFTLTCAASGLLIAMGVPPVYSLATGVAYYGKKHLNIKTILGKDKPKE